MRKYKVSFEYTYGFTNKWYNNDCEVYANNEREAEEKVIALYGLGVDYRFHIVSIIEV